uniref:Uncharacterized protein n=1 Tax=Rhizophagus irregularis (strain DAOM 181602 / DAOM 197198 / MUCL 43194) TaxID=747089 RepID=U9T0E9_RHIID
MFLHYRHSRKFKEPDVLPASMFQKSKEPREPRVPSVPAYQKNSSSLKNKRK